MRYRTGLLLASVLFAAIPLASAQAPAADPKKTLVEAANALGMVRGVNHSLTVVNMFEYTASGTMADPNGGQDKVSRITVGYDYVIPAIRLDVEKILPNGQSQREIEVAAGSYTWDETQPGIYLRSSKTPPAERLRQIYLMPHALVLAGAKAPDKVRVAERGGMRELIVPGPDGTEISGVLDAKNFPIHVELKSGGKLYSADFGDYKDYQDYGVMFPSRIEQRIDGRPVADLAVSESLANPYLIFPPPKEVTQK